MSLASAPTCRPRLVSSRIWSSIGMRVPDALEDELLDDVRSAAGDADHRYAGAGEDLVAVGADRDGFAGDAGAAGVSRLGGARRRTRVSIVAPTTTRLRVRYALAAHTNVYVPKFKSADSGSVFDRAAASLTNVTDTTTLPGVADAGLFRVEAKRHGTGRVERVLAVAAPPHEIAAGRQSAPAGRPVAEAAHTTARLALGYPRKLGVSSRWEGPRASTGACTSVAMPRARSRGWSRSCRRARLQECRRRASHRATREAFMSSAANPQQHPAATSPAGRSMNSANSAPKASSRPMSATSSVRRTIFVLARMDVSRTGQPAGGTRLSVCAPSCSTTSMFAHSATKSNTFHTGRRRCSKQEPGARVVAWLAGLRLALSHITSAVGPSSDLVGSSLARTA